MQVFVINLASANKRRVFQEKQLHRLGFSYEIICATTTNDIDDDIYYKHCQDWQRLIRKSEIACYFSHRRCWEKVISSQQPALILEDDALLSSKLPSILSKLSCYIDIDLVDLEVTGRKKSVSKKSEVLHQDNKILKLYINSSGAGGYVLFPSGAKKLLDCERQKGISLADAHIARCYTLNAYQVEPAPVIQFIVCPQYDINNLDYVAFSSSSTNQYEKDKKTLKFRMRRILSEIQLGIRKMALSMVSHRRYIDLNKKDFS